MKRTLVLIFLILLAGSARADYLFTEKNGNTFVWPFYKKQGTQYCTRLYTGKFCTPTNKIASIRKVNKRDVEPRKAADARAKTYTPILPK